MEQQKLALGSFDLIRPIGKGSMGVVWEGIHRAESVPVAVKVITANVAEDDGFRVAFANEVRSVARLHHPSIIKLLDYGATDSALFDATGGEIAAGSQYYVMELATGGTLPRPKTPLPWVYLRFLLLELIDALAHAHARDVIHRDIKPSNILLMQDDTCTRLKLTDFGIAKAMGVKEQFSGIVAGTPRYMAPEQILNQTRDQGPWTDLYSLGCLAYQFATGKRIFAHATGTDVLRSQLHERPESVSAPHLPAGFQCWLDRMLAKKTRERFQYAAEAAWELACLQDPEVSDPKEIVSAANVSAADIVAQELQSCEHSAISEVSGSSNVFDSICAGRNLSHRDEQVDLSEALLNDVGDTLRMDSADIVRVITQQAHSAQARVSADGGLATLAEVFRKSSPSSSGECYQTSGLVPAPDTWRRELGEKSSDSLLGAGLGLWGLRAIPMVNRYAERDIIYEQMLAVRREHRPRCIFIDGARGTGKSRLVEWMCQRAHELSIAHTIKALHYADYHSAPGTARAMMYDLVCQNLPRHEALTRVKRFLAEHPLEPEFDDALPIVELMHLQDDPEYPLAGIRFNTVEEQYAVLHRNLIRRCQDRPVILWFDDVHYATSSLEFIEFVMTHSEAANLPLLILCTCRSEDLEEGSPQAKAFERLVTLPKAMQMTIEPLESEAHLQLVRELIGLDEQLCQQVAQRTSGMPLYAIQLVGDWVERGVLVPGSAGFTVKEGASEELPDSLHELWLSRLRLIFKDFKRQQLSWEQLEIAACLGNQFDADEWRIACETSELGSNVKTLERMLEHQLFEMRYPVIRFKHDLLRESLTRYAQENSRFKQHHLTCADMLQAYFSDALVFYHERRADHLWAAQAYESAIEPFLQAGILRRLRSEYGLAHSLFHKRELALDACRADENSPIRALGWIAEANTYLQQSQLDLAESLIERACSLSSQTQSPVVQALAYKEKGLLLQYRNDISGAIDALMVSLSFFNQISERRRVAYLNDRAETLWLIGRVCGMRHELDLARTYLQQAIEIQTQTRDQFGLARSYKELSNTFQHGGLYEEARVNIEFALNIFQQMGYRLYIAHCFNNIGEIYRLGYGQPDQAEVYYRNAMVTYRELNAIEGCTATINLVLLLLAKQRYTEAKAYVLNQIEITERSGQTLDLNWLYAELLPCCAAGFDWPAFDDTVVRLEKSLRDSMVVDADILYCTELAANLCDRYASKEQGRLCREIALQQAIRLNDKAAIERLQR